MKVVSAPLTSGKVTFPITNWEPHTLDINEHNIALLCGAADVMTQQHFTSSIVTIDLATGEVFYAASLELSTNWNTGVGDATTDGLYAEEDLMSAGDSTEFELRSFVSARWVDATHFIVTSGSVRTISLHTLKSTSTGNCKKPDPKDPCVAGPLQEVAVVSSDQLLAEAFHWDDKNSEKEGDNTLPGLGPGVADITIATYQTRDIVE